MDAGDCVWLTSDPDVVTARERGRALAATLGFSPLDQARIEATISEPAISMLTYARSGEIRIAVVTQGGETGLRIVARDWGTASNPLALSNVRASATTSRFRAGPDEALSSPSRNGSIPRSPRRLSPGTGRCLCRGEAAHPA
jgi:anti-sigma regulatory factor (Ser/Thr protein kinase)